METRTKLQILPQQPSRMVPPGGRRPLITLLGSLVALLLSLSATAQTTFFVATNGVDLPANGSATSPWATIEFALQQVADGSIILVRPGTYTGRIRVRGQFTQGVLVRSEVAYRARLRHNSTVLTVFNDSANIEGISFEGFDIAHSGAGASALVVQIQDGFSTDTRRITLRNNILHDSFNNDILKINNGASDIRVVGNMFYNQQGSDEHIDVNSVDNVIIEDNVFFNDFAASGRPVPLDTASFIVIKDSNGSDDEYLGARNVSVRRNVFANWQGSIGSNFLLLGEDGTANVEAFDITAENNLFIGNSNETMRAAFGCKGCADSVFRANTVVGDLPSNAYAMRINREGDNPIPNNVSFRGNLWADTAGSMGDFSDTSPGDVSTFILARNGYWNAGNPLPNDAGDLINISNDATRITADPALPSPTSLLPPWWEESLGQFRGGFTSIRMAFVGLVEAFGRPAANGAGINAADPAQMPNDDILGVTRGTAPDLGAVERIASSLIFANGFEG
ncbi:MAG: hypothetical protein ACT4NL_02230 [Pseudomarimonas sp.]